MKKTSFKLLFILLIAQKPCLAKTFKMAALAPEGTSWANNLKDMAKEIKAKTKGRVKFKIHLGGVAGDEPVVLKKIRIGQMHGGVFTGRALGDIYPDIRLIELPFSFGGDNQKGWKALQKMAPLFNRGLKKNNFVNLGFVEIGNVYLVSTKKVADLKTLKGLKVWAWAGDVIVKELVRELKLLSVPLGLPDVLPSLSTNVIDVAYSSPLGILALQWHKKIKYLVDFPITFSIGAYLIDRKSWQKINSKDQKIVKSTAKKYLTKANQATREENQKTLLALKTLGIEFLPFNNADINKGAQMRNNVLARLKKTTFSQKSIKSYQSVLNSLK